MIRLATQWTCKQCGSHKIKQLMGVDYCSDCEVAGRGIGDLISAPVPCHICGTTTQLQGYDMCNFCELVTGMYEWVPGLPRVVNLCQDPKCFTTLKKQVDKIMSEAFFE